MLEAAGQVLQGQAGEDNYIEGVSGVAQEGTAQASAQPQEHQGQQRPRDGERLAGQHQGQGQGGEKRGQGQQGDEQVPVLHSAAQKQHHVQHEVEGQGQRAQGGIGSPPHAADDAVGNQAGQSSVEDQIDDFQHGGFDAAPDVVQIDQRGVQDEEGGQCADGQVKLALQGVSVRQGGQVERVGEQETQVVEQPPLFGLGDPQNAEAQHQQVGVEHGQVRGRGAQQDGRAVAADQAEDGHQHGVLAHGQHAHRGRHQHHKREGRGGGHQLIQRAGGVDAEVEDGNAAAHKALAQHPPLLAEHARARGQQGQPEEDAEPHPAFGSHQVAFNGPLQKIAHTGYDDHDAGPDEPGGGYGVLHGHAGRTMLLAHHDPAPDAAQDVAGRLHGGIRGGRRG
jgi:hypothetical protein